MTNDYEGKLRYEARYQELAKEAQGGWLLKAAQAPDDARPAGLEKLKRVLPLVWALVAAAIVVLVVAVTVAGL